MRVVMSILRMLRRWSQAFGPYVMLEILLPGGTLIALLLFLYRRRSTMLMPAFAALGAGRWPGFVSNPAVSTSNWRASERL